MRKRVVLASVIAAILVISATAVLSHPGWRGGRLWRGDKAESVTLEGKIKDAERPVVTMDIDGKEYILHLGPRWYWQEKAYSLKEDQAVKIAGVVEELDGVSHVYVQTIQVDGESIELIDDDGAPVWAGRGARRGGGFRHGYGCYYGRGRGPMHGGGWHGHRRRGC